MKHFIKNANEFIINGKSISQARGVTLVTLVSRDYKELSVRASINSGLQQVVKKSISSGDDSAVGANT